MPIMLDLAKQLAKQSATTRRYVLILYWIVMFTMTHWPDIGKFIPDRPWLFEGFDKVVHFGLYVGWVVVWWWLLSANRRSVGFSSVNWLIAGGVVYAAFDEVTQAFVARDPEVLDFVCDVAAILIVTTVLRVWQSR